MKHTFCFPQWQWHELKQKNENLTKNWPSADAACRTWIENLTEDQTNLLDMYTAKQTKEALWGSLVYIQDAEKENEKSVFHFYVTRKELITIGIDFQKLKHLNVKNMKEKMQDAESPIEGFLVLMSEITAEFLKQIDGFEIALHNLLWEIRKQNNINLLDRVARADQDLLIWKNLIIPVAETQMALREAFGEEAADSKQYKLAKHRVERAQFLVRSYEEELDSLLDFEGLVSAHRGNEIFKTLTVITTLFAPATVLGAIWGMNFDHMPELKWKFGYLFSGLLMLISTLAIYFYLRGKGWIGDILNTKNKKSFFR